MRRINTITFTLLTLLLISSCGTVPLTGRKQVLLVSDSEVLSLSNQSFTEYMATAKPSTNPINTAMVVRVGKKIAAAVESYLNSHGLSSEVKNFAWEFHLVKDTSANAFCMPGGKIVVNEGLLPITKTEAALAIVLGHEVAHAVAKHSAERMSQQMVANYGGQLLGAVLSTKSAATQQIVQSVYGLGANYGVMLPYSRKNESEADEMGLIFAAMAGYDPQVAVSFWQRMSASGTSTPAFFSTHPSDSARIANIKKEMPEALRYYNVAKGTTLTNSKATNKKSTSKK